MTMPELAAKYRASATLLYSRLKELESGTARYNQLNLMYKEAAQWAHYLEEKYGSLGNGETLKTTLYCIGTGETEVEFVPGPRNVSRQQGNRGKDSGQEGPDKSPRYVTPETERILDALLGGRADYD